VVTSVSDGADLVLKELARGERRMLRDLRSTPDVPRIPGIYSLWHGDLCLYVGIARVDPANTRNPQAAGVAGRLDTYRRCRLTSDFAIACAFRFVVPELDSQEVRRLAAGERGVRDVQTAVEAWVNQHVSFSASCVRRPACGRSRAKRASPWFAWPRAASLQPPVIPSPGVRATKVR